MLDPNNPYCQAIIGQYEKDGLLVSTIQGCNGYETAISHPLYNDDVLIIVSRWDNEKAALQGHNEWVVLLYNILPKDIVDCKGKTHFKDQV